MWGIIVMFLIFCAIIFLTYFLGWYDGRNSIREEAMNRNLAYYNNLTGDWEWKG